MIEFRLLYAPVFAIALAACGPSHAGQIPPPLDLGYPGTIILGVDVSDTERRVYVVHESVPVTSGSQVLLFPQWIPGRHGPVGMIERLAGLRMSSDGVALDWARDPVDPFAFRITVPPGIARLDIQFQYVKTPDGDRDRTFITSQLERIQWHELLLYPAGYFARDIQVSPSLTLPTDWQIGTALAVEHRVGARVDFHPVSLETLVDSPVLAGRYFEHIDLDPGAKQPVSLDVAAERPEQLVIPPAALDAHRALGQQAFRLFQSRHFDQYHFLVSVSETAGFIGLEHHQSSEDSVAGDYFTDWSGSWLGRDLLAHEFVHSWNGKFRRPADLATPNFNVPMQNDLLWMYEGQTDYWGLVLAVRAGMLKPEQAREILADVAAGDESALGRSWRNLQDTTNDPIYRHTRPSWPSWQRGRDYYSEMQLVWLDVDTTIRELSGGARSLDNFARAFFGFPERHVDVMTYEFEDVVAALNQVQPHGWAAFLRNRLDNHESAPLEGLRRSGWRLVFTEEPNAAAKIEETASGTASLRDSLGMQLSREGIVSNVRWEGPAFRAHLAPGMKLIAVNSRSFKIGLLRDAINSARGGSASIELLMLDNDIYRTVRVDYHDGLRYPHLERVERTQDLLTAIFSPLP
jgi:predicted metalloprotease with PDZ domain